MPENDQDPTRFDLPVDQTHRMSLDEGLGLHPDHSQPPQEPKVRRRLAPAWIAGIVAGGVVLLAGAVYLIDYLSTKDQIAQDVVIGGVEVGGLTPDEARQTLLAEVGTLYQAPITVTAHGDAVTLLPVDAGLRADISSSVQAVGLRGANPFDRIASFSGTTEAPVIVSVDDAALKRWLESLAGDDDVAAVEGSVTLVDGKVVVVEPVIGERLDIDAAAEKIRAAWVAGGPQAVSGMELPEDSDGVRASAAGVAKAASEAKKILSGPLKVKAAGTTIEVPVEVIASAMTISPDKKDGFTVKVDPAPIKVAFADKAAATQTEPADATLEMTGDGPQITESTIGRTVDFDATLKGLNKALRGTSTLKVVYQEKAPEVSTKDIKALGITEVVSEFTTGGFAYDSGQNVKRTAEIVNGAIVRPGETFSLNQFTGPRGVDQGFVEAGIIENGVAARAVGGGISQFATTLYNASYFAGMQDVEHQAHSFYISRYPEGREATVFQNPDGSSVIDVAFKNTFDTAIWIQTVWTESDITVRFWGTPTVKVESITGERYDFTSAPTKTVPYGQACSPTSGSGGFSVDNTRVISDLAGKEIDRQTQSTVYNGQQAIICEPAPVTQTTETAPGSGEAAPPVEGQAPEDPADTPADPTGGR
ncbi:vanomycin resistance protein VanB [Nakamurella silvestris]|nr:vanomycin resistance protein VanB [Nakamurella silvestris]